MEGPVDEATGLTGFFANVINIQIPGEFFSKNDAKKFSRRHTFNGLIFESKRYIRKRISLCMYGVFLYMGPTHRYTPEISELTPSLSWHGAQIGGLRIFFSHNQNNLCSSGAYVTESTAV